MTRTNKGFVYWLNQLIAWIFAISLVLTLPLTIAARDLGVVVFSRVRVSSILQSRLVESGILNQILIDSLLGPRGFADGDEWFRRSTEHLSDPERQEVLALLLPEGWIEVQISNLTDSMYSWFESDRPAPELFLDMQPIKGRLLEESLDQVIEIFVDSWPSCSPEEVDQLQRALNLGTELPAFVCEPPEPLRGTIVDIATRGLANETGGIPERLPLIERETVDLSELQATKRSLRSGQALLAWAWLVPMALLGPIMALKIRSFKGLGIWWGLPLFYAGLATLFLNVMMLRGAQNRLVNFLLQDLGTPGSTQFGVLDQLLRGAVSQMSRLMFFHALLLSAGGIGAWFMLSRRDNKVREASAEDAADQTESERSQPGSGVGSRVDLPPPLPPLNERNLDGDHDGPPSGIFG